MRSASSTASRTANSLAAMSVMKPRLTPRLSRWPVPSTVRRPSSSGRAIIALTLDEPMSSAAISGWSAALRPSALLRRRRGERLARRARQADDHLAGHAQVEADDAAAEQAADACRACANLTSAALAASSPSGSATVSPDWKLRSQRRPPTQVAEASCGLSVGTARHQPAQARCSWPLAPGPISSGRSGILSTGTRSSTTPSLVDQRELALVLPQRGGRALDDVDDQRVGQAPRDPRILDPAEAEQPAADLGDVDQRLRRLVGPGLVGGAAQLVGDDRVDQRCGSCG